MENDKILQRIGEIVLNKNKLDNMLQNAILY